ncbi:MAG: DUF3179 domain-containing protein [Bacteroidetes bacterium]|jgi:hypothetical protein|nr:MAG: DUF3179 domain-containing protein [Bacteroidota bacterium]UCE70390.1 MAG: DUF3179 domain-containing protein [Flavobacteriaceae bacterium]
MRTLFILLLLVQVPGCLQGQRPSALNAGKFIQSEDYKLLYGGEDPSQHFNIDNLDLKPEQFHYGIGRERFPALIQPKFESVTDAAGRWKPSDRFLVAKKDGEVKAYSVKDLTRHEVVNDSIGGEPIFAAYCILADLGAIYKRKYGDKLFTFAVSGYTYNDPQVWNGMDGFILWDRETESLWWPLIDKAVSGPLKEVGLQKLESAYWQDTTWEKVKAAYPEAMILIPGQQMDPPGDWNSYKDVSDVVSRYRQ